MGQAPAAEGSSKADEWDNDSCQRKGTKPSSKESRETDVGATEFQPLHVVGTTKPRANHYWTPAASIHTFKALPI